MFFKKNKKHMCLGYLLVKMNFEDVSIARIF